VSRPRSRWARRIRPLAAIAVLAALALPGTTATATAQATAQAAAGLRDIGGTAWVTDPATGTVHVLADETVSDDEMARLTASASDPGLTVERVPGTLSPRLRAGEAIYADAGWRCTAGLNVRSGSSYYFLTAGHCASGLPTWYANASLTTSIGPTTAASFPGDDHGIVRYANAAVPHPSQVNCNGAAVEINRAGNATVGQAVRFAGATSGCHSGVVTGLNATVNYAEGTVSGLIQTNICTEPGDSGGLLFSGDKAIGILSGGTGNCATGGYSYFQPITEAMAFYGVSIP
jgi:streptogrisin B